jgi:hypothetical protein
MTNLRSVKELWSDISPARPCLIMGNSPSLDLYPDETYDQFFTIGCNSRLHTRYVPDLTMMIDRRIPDPNPEAELISQIDHWKQTHPGTVYAFQLGLRLQFHPDISSDKIDYSITSPYMAICVAYMMGWRSFNLIGIDLGMVNGKNYHDDKDPAPTVTRPGFVVGPDGTEIADPLFVRRRFLAACYNHMSYLINKMSTYHNCQFFSLSPYSQLLQNGNVKKVTP